MTLDELYAEANRLCREHWGVEFTGRIELVKRPWRRYNGICRYNKCLTPSGVEWDVAIIMSEKRNAERTREEVLGTLLHELVHWRLFTEGLKRGGLQYARSIARDDSPEFVRECQRVGAPFSHTVAAQKAAKRYGGQR